jgi:lipopolysaccharide export system permease protein
MTGKFKFSKYGYSIIPRISVMDRYLAAELIPPFLFGVGAFSSLGITIGTAFDLVRKIAESGLPIAIVFKVLLLNMPQFIAYALPMSVLLAALMTYSRLSSDSELIALRSSGVTVFRPIVPAVILSLVVTGATFVLNEMVVPAANYEASTTLEKALKQDKVFLQGENIFYPVYNVKKQPNGDRKKNLSLLFYAEKFDGQRMQNLTVVNWSDVNIMPEIIPSCTPENDKSASTVQDKSKEKIEEIERQTGKFGVRQIVVSESAVWDTPKNLWNTANGTIYSICPNNLKRNTLEFGNGWLHLSRSPLDLLSKERDYQEMNIEQSLDYLQVLEQNGDEKKILKLKVRIQQKIAFPFVCLVFGLVGATLGSKPQRTGKTTSFAISLLVIFTYYLLLTVTGVLGQIGMLPPLLAAWMPNIFGLAAGGWLVFRASR